MYSPKLEEQAETLFQYHRDVAGFYNDLARSEGLTLASLTVLHVLLKEKNCTHKTIADATYFPKQTVNAIIKSFKDKGIINPPVESASDKRNKVLTFTVSGRKYALDIVKKAKSIELHALDILGEENRKILIDIIKTYKDNLKLKKTE